MRLTVLALAALSITTAGCAIDARSGSRTPSAEPVVATVMLLDGELVVTPAIIVFDRHQGPGPITWRLADDRLAFPDNGIRIDGSLPALVESPTVEGSPKAPARSIAVDPNQREILGCKPNADKREFTCFNAKTRIGIYKYTITVNAGGKTLSKDPPIVNMY